MRTLDPKAFTDEGAIKSFEIDEETTRHNPMGGINGSIYINEDTKLEILFILDKDNENKFKKNVISGYSNNLKLLLEEKNN